MDNVIENFVSYASFYEAIEKLPTEEHKGKASLALLRLGHTGEWNTGGDIMIDMLLTLALPNIAAAKHRYAKAVENGSKGGRPKVDRMKIVELKNSGMTNEEVAAEMGCSAKTVSRALTESGWTKPDKRQNLDIDNNIDNNINNNNNTDIKSKKEKEIEINNTTDIESKESLRQSEKDFWEKNKEDLAAIDNQQELKRVVSELAPKFGWEWLNYAMAGRAAAFNKHGFGLLYTPTFQQEVSEGLFEFWEIEERYGAGRKF